jgi:beta-xylosidase
MIHWLRNLILVLLSIVGIACPQPETLQSRADFRIRDPYILVDRENGWYYLYSTMTTTDDNSKKHPGVGVRTSRDLQLWNEQKQVLQIPDGYWGEQMLWAPEVHKYRDKYYIFTTLTGGDSLKQIEGRPPIVRRASFVFWSDKPTGPFLPFTDKPHTPENWMALDATLWVEDDVPWMIFCHEWIQVTDGTMELVQMTSDLSSVVGTPTTLFTATEGNWVRSLGKVGSQNREGYVTDGPFLYRTKTGRLLMIWSSFGEQKYAVAVAYSETGKITGPWTQVQEPLFKANGGHGMLFTSLDDKLMLSLHQPNSNSKERLRLFELDDLGERLAITGELPMPESGE